MPETYTLQDWIISIAMHNQAFREELVHNPKETLERELGISFPPEVEIEMHQDTPTIIHLCYHSNPRLAPLWKCRMQNRQGSSEELDALNT